MVVSEVERDLDTFDDFYVVCRMDYNFAVATGRMIGSKFRECMTVWPPSVQLFSDKFGNFGRNDLGQKLYICVEHRDKIIAIDDRVQKEFKFFESGAPACPECGLECIVARMEISPTFDGHTPDIQPLYFGENEVIHSTGKYLRGKIYGYSPIFTIWAKIVSMYSMDEYVRTYFDKQRPPKGILILGTRNHESLKKSFDDMKQTARTDPYGFHALIVDTDRAGRSMAQHINLTGSLEDLQFTQVRDEYRRSIGAMYGVQPFFSGDLASGWNQEGTEVMVTNRAIAWGQRFIGEKFLKPLCRKVGVVDWYVSLKLGEEMDEMRKEQIQTQKIQNAQIMAQMGYKHYQDGDGNFVFSQKPVAQTEMNSQLGSNALRSEQMTKHQGQPHTQRPSDPGGKAQGHPASGPHTSQSNR